VVPLWYDEVIHLEQLWVKGFPAEWAEFAGIEKNEDREVGKSGYTDIESRSPEYRIQKKVPKDVRSEVIGAACCYDFKRLIS
jgi:hypothetical protein